MKYQVNRQEIPIGNIIKAIIEVVNVVILIGSNDKSFRNLFGLFRRSKVVKYPVLQYIQTETAYFGRVLSLDIGDGINKSGYFSQKHGWAIDKHGETLNVEGGIKELSEMLIERGIIIVK